MFWLERELRPRFERLNVYLVLVRMDQTVLDSVLLLLLLASVRAMFSSLTSHESLTKTSQCEQYKYLQSDSLTEATNITVNSQCVARIRSHILPFL